MKIAIAAPTGNIGSKLTELLLDKGHQLTLLARDPSKVERFAQRGASVAQGSLADRYFVTGATSGVEALFWLTPPNYGAQDMRREQADFGRVAAEAVRTNRIPRVVNLSSYGAQNAEGAGPISGLHEVEKAIEQAAEDVTHLRPVSFMENVLNSLSTIKTAGAIYLPISGKTKTPLVATRDIAKVAALRLQDKSWTGRHALRVQGPDDLTFDGIAGALSRVAGRDVRHVQVSPDQARQALEGTGVSPDVASQFLEMYQAFESGLLESGGPDLEKVTTETTFEIFAKEILKPLLAD